VTGAMGLTLDVATEETPDHVRLNLTGEGADVFLRRKGEPLDALQVIVNTAFRREDRGERHYVVDVQGFRKEQDEELRKEARALAAKVQAPGEDEEMGPLNPYARRIVHLAVAENPAVTTESFGEDLLKTVVISVKRA
jgi:spoIIIJ-associated protein